MKRLALLLLVFVPLLISAQGRHHTPKTALQTSLATSLSSTLTGVTDSGPACNGAEDLCATFNPTVAACNQVNEGDGGTAITFLNLTADPPSCQVPSLFGKGLQLEDLTVTQEAYFEVIGCGASEANCTLDALFKFTGTDDPGGRPVFTLGETTGTVGSCQLGANGATNLDMNIEANDIGGGAAIAFYQNWSIDTWYKIRLEFNANTGACEGWLDPGDGVFGAGVLFGDSDINVDTDAGAIGHTIDTLVISNADNRITIEVDYLRAGPLSEF